ncbi:siderophore-interacting protein [Sinorhizobium garamanticum]|uniref:Siderophore-interacting protein n=1 Tax=Sinorhizobium garamanticum TaxID=680247 RepID=A0ABY8DKG0_9HYPH|nr:siderophore-interacting protein [Sinorhizobium garamanticum]WEX90697.1 siderophore-interacting protein [Sinorhizobium garamanticum]
MRELPHRLQAKIVAERPEHLFERLHAHLLEHDVDARLSGDSLFVDLPAVSGTLRLIDGGIEVDVAATDLESLYFAKVWLQDAVAEERAFGTIRIVWSEDCLQRHLPPSFAVLTVDDIVDITPRMRRIRFRTANARSFETLDDMHLRILFNFQELAEQHASRGSRRGSSPSDVTPIWRAYTVRFVEPENHIIAVDFVLHNAEGPGSRWAMRARRGDVVGAAGPSGGGCGDAVWYLLAGDETALPAISRILESLDERATATVVIEVGSPTDTIPFTSRAAVETRWLYRENHDGDCRGLARVIASMDFPDASRKRFVWIASESETAKAVRATLRDRGFTKEEQSVAAYWHAT